MMRRFAAVLVMSLVPAALSGQDTFEGVIAYDVTAAGTTMSIRQMTKGTQIRQEMQGPMGEMVTLADTENRTVTTIMPAQKMYMRIDMDAMMERMQQMQQQQQIDPEPGDFRATGRSETIAGHGCEHYEYAAEDTTVDVCVASGLGFVPFSPPGSSGGMARAARLLEWKRHFSGGYVPLSMTVTTNGQTMTMKATSIEKRSLSDDLFAVPDGYTEMRMPGE